MILFNVVDFSFIIFFGLFFLEFTSSLLNVFIADLS